MKSSTKVRAAIIGVALSIFVLIQLLSRYPTFVEAYYSNGLYPFISFIVSSFTNQFGFSISEFLAWFLLLIALPLFIRRIIKRRRTLSRILLNLLAFFSVIVVWFYLSWGLNYLRLPLKTKLELDKVQLPLDAFDSTLVDIVRHANELNMLYTIKDVDTINSEIEDSYQMLLTDLGLATIRGSKNLKTFTGNWVLNKTTTSGWFSPFLHEVHYNKDMLEIEMPFVIAHEKAHQMGYTNEAEANFLGYLVCLNSTDPLVRYSGYFNALGYFLQSMSKNHDKRDDYVKMLTEGVKLDLKAVQERWKKHQGFVSNLSSKGYDLYLKANQVRDGTNSYTRVVDLIIKYYNQQTVADG